MELGITSSISLVNPNIGDLALADTGREVTLSTLAAEVSQRLHIRFQFFKGEWFLNLDEGVPYYQLLFVKAPSDRVIRVIFSGLIRDTEGVADVLKLDYSISAQRTLSLTFEARLEDGTTFRSLDYAPFVLAV